MIYMKYTLIKTVRQQLGEVDAGNLCLDRLDHTLHVGGRVGLRGGQAQGWVGGRAQGGCLGRVGLGLGVGNVLGDESLFA